MPETQCACGSYSETYLDWQGGSCGAPTCSVVDTLELRLCNPQLQAAGTSEVLMRPYEFKPKLGKCCRDGCWKGYRGQHPQGDYVTYTSARQATLFFPAGQCTGSDSGESLLEDMQRCQLN